MECSKNMNEELFEKVKRLNLPIREYALFGSAPMGVRELKECHDIDIIVTEDLFEKFKGDPDWQLKLMDDSSEYLENDSVELWKNWGPGEWDIGKLIKEAEFINDLPFVKLNYLIQWKKLNAREKDLKDIEVVENYLKGK